MVQLDNFVMMRWEAEATVIPAESRSFASFRLLLYSYKYKHQYSYTSTNISIAVILASLHLVKLRLSNLYKKLSSTKRTSSVILHLSNESTFNYII